MFNAESNPFMKNDLMKQYTDMFNGNNDMMKNFTNMFNGASNPMMDMFKSMSTGNNAFPMANMNFNTSEMFSNIMKTYNNMSASTEQAFGPMFRMMTPNSTKASLELMKSIAHKMNQYQIKNAEMQYMTYTATSKASTKFAEIMQNKMTNKEDFKGMNALYMEWLNTSDKCLVELYQSDEYSKLQGEVAALTHGLKKEIETMMEKMMVNIPVITRTEMDDTYKTIYDLKKRVKDLERTQAATAKTPAAKVEVTPTPAAKPTVAATVTVNAKEVTNTAKPAAVKTATKVAAKPVAKAKPAVKKTGRK